MYYQHFYVNSFLGRKLRKFITYYLLFVVAFSNAQTFGSRSAAEKKWAIFHPFAALKVRKVYKEAKPIYEQLKQKNMPDSFENGGKLDAFRHVFFMAAFAQKIKAKKVLKLGIAHEKGNYRNFLKSIKEDGELADSLSSVMDLQNNYFGVETGIKHKEKNLQELSAICLTAIVAGNAVYFKRDVHGNYLTCRGERIDLNDYRKKWFIPKCLMNTHQD